MEFLADTVTIVRHFSRTGRIGERAKQLLQSADRGEDNIAVMTVIEILYLSEKQRIPLNLAQFTEKMFALTNYRLIDIDLAVILEAHNVRGLELHDRLIVSTSRMLGVPVLTPDEEITDSGLVEVIWKRVFYEKTLRASSFSNSTTRAGWRASVAWEDFDCS